MKSVLLAFVAVFAVDSIFGVSVVIKQNKVYVDDKPVDLSKLEVLEDMPHATRYLLHAGDTNITITKSKFGNAISVSSQSSMSPEEAAKVKEFHEKLTQKISEKVEKVQQEVDTQIKEMNAKMKQQFQSLFKGFPFF